MKLCDSKDTIFVHLQLLLWAGSLIFELCQLPQFTKFFFKNYLLNCNHTFLSYRPVIFEVSEIACSYFFVFRRQRLSTKLYFGEVFISLLFKVFLLQDKQLDCRYAILTQKQTRRRTFKETRSSLVPFSELYIKAVF